MSFSESMCWEFNPNTTVLEGGVLMGDLEHGRVPSYEWINNKIKGSSAACCLWSSLYKTATGRCSKKAFATC